MTVGTLLTQIGSGFAWLVALPLILAAYGRALLWAAKFRLPTKYVIAGASWIACSIALVTALFVVVEDIGNLTAGWTSLLTGMSIYLLASIPGFLFWRRHYLARLKSQGYFLKRQ